MSAFDDGKQRNPENETVILDGDISGQFQQPDEGFPVAWIVFGLFLLLAALGCLAFWR